MGRRGPKVHFNHAATRIRRRIMSKLAFLAVALAWVGIGTGSAVLAADEKVDLSGTWAIEIEIGGQTGAPEFMLKQEGDKLSGTYKGQFGEAEVTGKVKGKDVEFSFALEGSKVVYTGTIEEADVMKGKADYAGQAEGMWSGKRKKDD
jgi:hypothetical protein